MRFVSATARPFMPTARRISLRVQGFGKLHSRMGEGMFRGLLILSAALWLPAVAQAQYIGGKAPPPPPAPVAGYAESPGAALARQDPAKRRP